LQHKLVTYALKAAPATTGFLPIAFYRERTKF